MANETVASLVIVTPNMKCSAANKTNGLAFRITVKVDSVVYILGHEDTNITVFNVPFYMFSNSGAAAFSCYVQGQPGL